MSAIVIEHVKVSELPDDWRARLHIPPMHASPCTSRKRRRREAAEEDAENPLFGMWRDREEMADVEAYVRKLRAPRF